MSLSDWFKKDEGEDEKPPEPKPTITIREILEDYRKDFELRGCRSGKSLRSEMKTLNLYFGDLTADKLTRAMLREYQRVQRGAHAAATVNKSLAVLSAAFQVAVKNEKIESVPRFPQRLRAARPRQGFLEHSDYLAIRQELPSWAKDVLDYGYWAGWRKNEILGLTWKEADLEQRLVRLDPDRSKNFETRSPLPLRAWGLAAIQRRDAARVDSSDLVFLRSDGSRISSTTWHYTWAAATKEAGREGKHFHDLRRTVARRLEKSGMPRKFAMAWIGHKTEEMYHRYAIVNEKDLWEQADKFGDAIVEEIERSKSEEEDALIRFADDDAPRLRVVTSKRGATAEPEDPVVRDVLPSDSKLYE